MHDCLKSQDMYVVVSDGTQQTVFFCFETQQIHLPPLQALPNRQFQELVFQRPQKGSAVPQCIHVCILQQATVIKTVEVIKSPG